MNKFIFIIIFLLYGYFIFSSQPDENIDAILTGLPEEVIEKIKNSENEKNKFIELYKNLNNLDSELLILVNKENFLPKNYKPDDLVTLTNEDFLTDKKSYQLRKILINDLKDMFNQAKKDGIDLKIISAYRSYETQVELYNYWKNLIGEEKANKVSAKPGFSQHQLGTTIDFNLLKISFEETKEGKWLFKNSYKYGFILSYPKGKENITGYSYEPWHYRYVGKDAAYLIYYYFNNLMENFLEWYWKNKNEF